MWLFIILGLILFITAFIILISCLVIHKKSSYEEELELQDQEEYIKQYRIEQENKKNEN